MIFLFILLTAEPFAVFLQLRLRGAKLGGTCNDGVFEGGALHVQLGVELANLEQVGDAKERFDLVKGFEQEIRCARPKGAKFGFLIHVSGQHEHRQKNVAGLRT